ncbi:PilZ domain-containing protein [Anatilimnocola sp. NA78]|uniref:PilZ domain-containing protein n=1 Tax=Anatilimnocola sp. NA78 TaxID=3415683 RepID=UPI003CE4F985
MPSETEVNRRQTLRHRASLVLEVQPLSADQGPLGDPLHAVSIDLSQSGLCFCCDRPLLTDLVMVRIQSAGQDHEVQLLARRIRCRRSGPLFEIAIQFLEKVG